jgi:hypothetical protein
VPSRPVEQQHGVSACRDMARDFNEMKLHRLGVGVRERQRRADPARRANRAEQIGVVVALVGGLSWPRSALGPLAHEAVLLADARLVLEPDLNGRRFRQAVEMGAQRAREVFLYASTIRSSWAGWRGRALMWEKPSFFRSVPT